MKAPIESMEDMKASTNVSLTQSSTKASKEVTSTKSSVKAFMEVMEAFAEVMKAFMGVTSRDDFMKSFRHLPLKLPWKICYI